MMYELHIEFEELRRLYDLQHPPIGSGGSTFQPTTRGEQTQKNRDPLRHPWAIRHPCAAQKAEDCYQALLMERIRKLRKRVWSQCYVPMRDASVEAQDHSRPSMQHREVQTAPWPEPLLSPPCS